MDTSLATLLTCTQCGGELHPDEGQLFLTCPYCTATVYLDKSRVVFHWYLAPTLDEMQARGALARWMAGSQTVKDLDKKSRLIGQSFQYFPLWYFKVKIQNKEQISLEPAAATSVTELRQLNLPAGDLRKYESSLEAQAHPPSVPLEAARDWLRQARGAEAEVLETALVHVPTYTFKYIYQNQPYTALVEAATGKTLANIFPAKAEAPFRMVGGLAALVFLCLASIPVAGYVGWQNTGFTTGMLVCAGLGLIAAPILFALAAWVAAKV